MPSFPRTSPLPCLAMLMATAGLFGVPGSASADEHVGLTEYEISCMPCHGVEGRGDGPRAASLKATPADLTAIAKANGGRFPSKRVAEIIDGRQSLAAHGARDMPIWGARYRAAAEAGDSGGDAEKSARSLIKALVAYIATIQQR